MEGLEFDSAHVNLQDVLRTTDEGTSSGNVTYKTAVTTANVNRRRSTWWPGIR